MATVDWRALSLLYPDNINQSLSPWYVYVGVMLEAFAKEPLVGGLWKYLASEFPHEEDQLTVSRRLREGLLKASVLVGFPRVSALHAPISRHEGV